MSLTVLPVTSRGFHARHLERAAEMRRRAAHGFLENRARRVEEARAAILAAKGERSYWTGAREAFPLTYRLP